MERLGQYVKDIPRFCFVTALVLFVSGYLLDCIHVRLGSLSPLFYFLILHSYDFSDDPYI